MQVKYSSTRLRYSFNESIRKEDWNLKKQRIKNTSAVTHDGKYLLNDLLDTLATIVSKAYNEEIKNGIPTPSIIKERLDNFLKFNLIQEKKKANTPTFWSLAQRFIDGDISYLGKQKKPSTLKNYRNARNHILEFSKKEKYPVEFATISVDFFYRLTAFLRKKNLAHNTIAKTVAVIKIWMNFAVDEGLTTNMQHKHKRFSMPEIEVDAVCFTEEELIKLYHFDFSYNKKLERVRDLFLVGAYTGLRFSDFSNIKNENIITIDRELFIKLLTTKTQELVIVPVNPVLLSIMQKYKSNANSLPPSISNQKFNTYIKEVCLKVGFVEKGRLSTDPTKELWSLITSHTCRRTFCTCMHLAGVSDHTIMAISGHKTTKSYKKYLKISKLASAKRLQVHIKNNESKYFLSAVG